MNGLYLKDGQCITSEACIRSGSLPFGVSMNGRICATGICTREDGCECLKREVGPGTVFQQVNSIFKVVHKLQVVWNAQLRMKMARACNV